MKGGVCKENTNSVRFSTILPQYSITAWSSREKLIIRSFNCNHRDFLFLPVNFVVYLSWSTPLTNLKIYIEVIYELMPSCFVFICLHTSLFPSKITRHTIHRNYYFIRLLVDGEYGCCREDSRVSLSSLLSLCPLPCINSRITVSCFKTNCQNNRNESISVKCLSRKWSPWQYSYFMPSLVTYSTLIIHQ